jgi:hypothetical protein
MIFVHSHSAAPSRLAPVRGPGASWVRSTFLGYIAGVLLSSIARHAAPAGPPLRHTVIPLDVTAHSSLLDQAFAQLPMPRAGSSSEDQGQCEGGQAETRAADGQGRGEAISSG